MSSLNLIFRLNPKLQYRLSNASQSLMIHNCAPLFGQINCKANQVTETGSHRANETLFLSRSLFFSLMEPYVYVFSIPKHTPALWLNRKQFSAGFHVDTVVMNPPFGARRKGADMEFLSMGLKVRTDVCLLWQFWLEDGIDVSSALLLLTGCFSSCLFSAQDFH